MNVHKSRQKSKTMLKPWNNIYFKNFVAFSNKIYDFLYKSFHFLY